MKTSNLDSLTVSEHFYSIQGEGQTMGRPAYFLRLTHCNLMCGGAGTQNDGKLHNGATWRCDSVEVWMQGKDMSFPEIVEAMGGEVFIRDLECGVHLVVTGGEPMMQQERLIQFLYFLEALCSEVGNPVIEVETNGTIRPVLALLPLVDYWNVSPKLGNSGMKERLRYNADAIETLAKQGAKTIFKFVIGDTIDIYELDIYTSHAKRTQVWLMPAADNAKDLEHVSQYVAELAIKRRYNFTTRIHIAVWDKKTGV